MSLPNILLILAAISIGATVITIIIAFRSEREAKSAIFPIIREEEARRAQRSRVYIFGWAAITALFLGGWLATLQIIEPTSPQSDTPVAAEAVAFTTETPASVTDQSPTAALTVVEPGEPTAPPALAATDSTTQAAAPTISSEPTATSPPPTSTATPEPTRTPPPTATFTPTPTPLSDAFTIPTTGPRTPAPSNARMGPIQFATEITEDAQAINPADTFSPNVERIYAVFPYSGMENGVNFAIVWYKNGTELWRDESQWEWGTKARFFGFFNNPDVGLYKVELQVNDSILATGLVEVR